MDLTVRDVVKLLRVFENTVYRWVRLRVLPAYRVRDHYRFKSSRSPGVGRLPKALRFTGPVPPPMDLQAKLLASATP